MEQKGDITDYMIIHALQTVLHLYKKYLFDVQCTITAYTMTYSEYFLFK